MATTALSDDGAAAGAAPGTLPRTLLRQRLLAARDAWRAGAASAADEERFAAHLRAVLETLAPERLGTYWPLRGEFNAASALARPMPLGVPLALPHARRMPREMHFRAWDGMAPTAVDECGIPTADGPPVVPDVVLLPCVGFTRSGWRLGWGGGYFDRWLAAHPHAVTVGVAWSGGEIDDAAFAAEPHDIALTAIVTERGVVA